MPILVALGAALSLFVALYTPVVFQLGRVWWEDPNYAHGLWIPFIVLYVLWTDREKLAQLPVQPNRWGVLLCGLAVLLVCGGQVVHMVGGGRGALFINGVSLLFGWSGLVLLLLGRAFLKALALPIIYMGLMIPLPIWVFIRLTQPLQGYASEVTAITLHLFDIPILREGNVLILPFMRLGVEEACSGIRSLLALVAVAGGMALVFMGHWRGWLRLAFVFSAVPIAVMANAFRVIATGWMAYHWGIEKAQGFYHEFSGSVIFLVASLLLTAEYLFLSQPGLGEEAKT